MQPINSPHRPNAVVQDTSSLFPIVIRHCCKILCCWVLMPHQRQQPVIWVRGKPVIRARCDLNSTIDCYNSYSWSAASPLQSFQAKARTSSNNQNAACCSRDSAPSNPFRCFHGSPCCISSSVHCAYPK